MAGLTPFYRGDTWSISVDLSAYGISIEGHVFTVTLKADLADADADAALHYDHTVPAGASADAGLATIVVPSDQTDIAPGEYHYDIQWDRADGDPPTVLTILASGEQPDESELPKVKVLADSTRQDSAD